MNNKTTIEQIEKNARLVLKNLYDEAEKRNYNPPVPSEIVIALEDIISDCGDLLTEKE